MLVILFAAILASFVATSAEARLIPVYASSSYNYPAVDGGYRYPWNYPGYDRQHRRPRKHRH